MHKLPFAVLAITLVFALTTCKNPWINELLKSPSELSSLEVVAFAGETKLQGGAAFEPPFSAAVRDYLVYVPLETNHFTVNAGYDGNGTVTWNTAGMDGAVSSNSFTFNFYGIEDTINLTMTVERENMGPGEYHLSVTRTDNIPPPKIVAMNITPPVGSYFLESGIVPVVEVDVAPPTDGGTLAYQWFRNEDNNTTTGTLLSGATGTSYTLKGFETRTAGTMYYYVEVTKTLNGKTSKLASTTRSVNFLDRKESLDVKSDRNNDSTYWVDVPGGEVTEDKVRYTDPYEGERLYWASEDSNIAGYELPWSTEGFLMAKYPVTFELWELVRQYAEKENYKFGNAGNQGAQDEGSVEYPYNTIVDPRPVGNELHPVTMIGWRDAVVWCNAYSEMCGLDPVYCDSNGNVLRDSRQAVEWLIDHDRTVGKNGIRLPTLGELEYATRGADPDSTEWGYPYPGYPNPLNQCVYHLSDNFRTDEVGNRLPNSIGLYDTIGLVEEWCYLNHDLFLYKPVLATLAGAWNGGGGGQGVNPFQLDMWESPRYRRYDDATPDKCLRLVRNK